MVERRVDLPESDFELRLIVKNSRVSNLGELSKQTKETISKIETIQVYRAEIKRYGMYIEGYGPISHIMDMIEKLFPMTVDGSVYFLLRVGKRHEYLVKEGNVIDCNLETYREFVPAQFDNDAQPTEEDLARWGF